MKRVIIGIQARSTSSRFPRKVFELIDGVEMLQHIINSADKSALYLNKFSDKNNLKVSTVVLIPTGDEIKDRYHLKTLIFEGDENDVLARYRQMAEEMDPDYIVRITSDCPLLPSYVITKHINVAITGNYDYTSNVDENIRSSIDGHDVEVMSRRALEWADRNAKTKEHREHVTQVLRQKNLPLNFRVAHVVGHLYQPHIKLSVDTKEDLERVRAEYRAIKNCIDSAIEMHGEKSVHRI